MTENLEKLTLEHLCALRDGQARVEHNIDALTLRMGALEGQVAQLRQSVARIHEDIAGVRPDIAGLHQRFDHLIVRVERIERRLDLADAGD
jgi:chromosome segregation ATPase